MRLLTPAGDPGAPDAAGRPAARPVLVRWLSLAVLLLYGAVVVYTGGLGFDLVKDEEQFWAQVQAFASSWPPSLAELRSYGEPMTPLAFLLWAGVERLFDAGVAAARLLTMLTSLLAVGLIAFQRPAPGVPGRIPVLAAVALLAYPYWLPVSFLVYTDVPAAAMVVCGFFFYVRDRHVASAAFFVLAIATRQYMVTFPAAILVHEAVRWLFPVGGPVRAEGAGAWALPPAGRWLPYGAAVASLLCWFAFFGGFGPAPGLAEWPRHSEALISVEPAFALYALAAIGAYFVVIEFVIEGRWRSPGFRIDRPTAALVVAAALLFALFTPYYPERIGPLNRGLNTLLGAAGVGAVVRVVLLLLLMLATVVRFSRPGLGTWIVATNAAIMPLMWTPWEKYYMPTLAALWFLKAAGAIDDGDAGGRRGAATARGVP